MRAGKLVACLLASLLLAGCGEQVLHSSLSESEANELVALLYLSDLPAEKVPDKNGTFRVDTRRSAFADAVSLLQSHGLPRERFESLGEVFEKDGFVSSPLEERARLNYALSQEISRTISNIDGVIVARVHLAVPKREHLADSVDPSSASVFVKHRADIDLADSVGKIKSMVVTGFENLPYENVTVGLFPAEPARSSRSGGGSDDVALASVFDGPSPLATALFVLPGLAFLGLAAALFLRTRAAETGGAATARRAPKARSARRRTAGPRSEDDGTR